MPGSRATGGESQKAERPRFAAPSPLPIVFRLSPERDPPGLLRMQFQAELPQPFPQLLQESFRIRPLLKPHDEIVGIADDHYIASRHLLSPCLHPLVERVMQLDIG